MGKKLTDLTTRRVILITLLLVIVNPFFSGALEEDTHAYQESGLERLHHYPRDYNHSGSVDETLFRTDVRGWARNTGKWLSEMTRYRVFGYFARNGSVARLVSGQACVSLAVFDNREVTAFDAGTNTATTVFIMLVLVGANRANDAVGQGPGRESARDD